MKSRSILSATLSAGALLCLVLAFLGSYPQHKGENSAAVQSLVAEPNPYNLGKMHWGNYGGTLRLNNISKSRLEISHVSTSCGCTVATTDHLTLEPGQSSTLAFKFDSKGKEGDPQSHISVLFRDDLDDALSKLEIELVGNVVPDYHWEPRRISFRSDVATTEELRFYSPENEPIKVLTAKCDHPALDLKTLESDDGIRISFLPREWHNGPGYIRVVASVDNDKMPSCMIPIFVISGDKSR